MTRARRGRRIAPLLVCLLVPILAEVALRVLPIQSVEPTRDDPARMPLDRDRAYLEVEDASGLALVTRPEATMLRDVRFAPTKAPGTYRVFVVGGSSVFGLGVSEDSTLPSQIAAAIRAKMPNRTVEVINAGWIAADSERLRSLVSEVVHYDPDLVVAYTGQNEHFIHFDPHAAAPSALDRFADLLGRLRIYRLIDVAVGLVDDRRWQWGPLTFVPHDQVAAFYRENVRAMAAACRAHGVPFVFSTITANARSSSRQDVPLDDRERSALSQALDLELSGAFEAAIAAYSDLIERRPRIAEVRYRRGTCFEVLGRYGEARADYERAMSTLR